MPFVQRAGTDIHYDAYPAPRPDAEPLLFIPGLSASTVAFPSLFARLAETWRLIVIDPRGAGKTAGGLSRFSLLDIARDALAVLDAEGIERAHVLGLSMGGMISQELALDAPNRVRSLILCCTSCGRSPGVRPSPRVLSRLLGGLVAARGPTTAESIAAGFGGILFAEQTPMARRLEFFGPRSGSGAPTKRGIASQLLAVRPFASFDRLHAITAPTLVIHGDADLLVPTVNAFILADAIHGAETAILPGGHVFFYEYPNAFLARIRAFLDRVATGQEAA